MGEKNNKNHQYQEDTFYLGLTMAGAVSAGAYTGGVLDYLFEVLDKWEKAKTGELEIPGYSKDDIPKHKVVIDAMGGTSAGGMTTIMSAIYAIQGKINPIGDEHVDEVGGLKGNIFYDSWVNLDDDARGLTFNKALINTDIDHPKEKVKSLLNSKFLDRIAERAFAIEGNPDSNPIDKLPSYVSKDLEMLISHTMLKGIPLVVDFSHQGSSLAQPPSHASYEHFMFSHFKLNRGKEVDPQQYLWLNPYQTKGIERLRKAALATGAFPVGLGFRELNFEEEYVKNVISRILQGNLGDPEPSFKKKINWDEDALRNYNSVTVDGGAINNEPFAEVLSILKHRYGSDVTIEGKHRYQRYGMVMIDPFPNFHELRSAYEKEDSLLGVIPSIVGTLWDQAKIKRREMLDQFENEAYRGVIYPVKYKSKEEKYKNPLACGALGAFSGFLSQSFRHHDFYLGRNNARNFLRAYFSVPYEPEKGIIHPLHRDEYWTEEMRNRLKIVFKDGSTYLPLIPDMNMLMNKDRETDANDIFSYSVPEIPQISVSKINALETPVYLRSSAIFSKYLKLDFEQKRKKPGWFAPVTNEIISWFNGFIKKKLRAAGANGATELAIKQMKKDLKEAGLLKGSAQETIKKESKGQKETSTDAMA